MLLRYRFSLLSAVLALALSLGACAPMEDAGTPPQAPVSDTDTAPNETPADDSQASAGVMSRFTATDLEGVEVDQSIFSDYKLTMVNVWATFCTPCINEMPDLGELAAEYSDQGVPGPGHPGFGRFDQRKPGGDGERDRGPDWRGLPAPAPLARPVSYSVRHHRRTDHVFRGQHRRAGGSCYCHRAKQGCVDRND